MTCLMAGYIALRAWRARKTGRSEDGVSIVGDAATFATSVLLLLAVWFPATVLKAIGDTSVFLLIAAFSGLWGTCRFGWKPERPGPGASATEVRNWKGGR